MEAYRPFARTSLRSALGRWRCKRWSSVSSNEHRTGLVVRVHLPAEILGFRATADRRVVASACAVLASLKPDHIGVVPLAAE